MANYRKGVEMRNRIIQEARVVFNQEGLQLTLDELANRLELTKGRITNYFPTKDELFVALSQDYDIQFGQLMASFSWTDTISFRELSEVFSAIMDLQYEHRSTIIFAAMTNSKQQAMHSQITKSYRENSKQVSETAKVLVKSGLITPKILEKAELDIFSFQYVNLFTTWVISLEIYHSSKSYRRMKPIYLKGLLRCFFPYLTGKGIEEFNQLKIWSGKARNTM